MTDLAYTDDSDRSYGAAGMAIGLVVLDGEEVIAGISLDNADPDILELASGWDRPLQAQLTTKQMWNMMVRKFQLATAMTLGNVMCRRMVRGGLDSLDAELRASLRALAREEALGACSLDDDEADSIFNREVTYLQQVFRHSRVRHAAHDLAADIHRERRLSRHDVLERLRVLAML